MTMRGSTLIGVFDEPAMAERAIEELNYAGFSNDQISYSGSASTGTGFMAAIKSLFTGQEMTSSDFVNDLMGMGLSQDEAQFYAQQHQAGRAIVAVNPAGREQEALDILRRNGGYDYRTRAGAAQAGSFTETTAGYNQPPAYSQTTAPDTAAQYGTDEERRLKLREERLQAEKERVQTGETHLRKDVVEEQQSFNVPVTHEEVVVERRPGSGQPSDAPVGQDETLRVPVSEERVNVTKTPVETGEVVVRKQAVQENQPVSDTVRREEAHVEREGNPNVRTNDDQTNP